MRSARRWPRTARSSSPAAWARNPKRSPANIPNVLAVTGPQQYESVVKAVHKAAPPQHDPFVDLVPPEGIKLTPRHYAYLKISEGCNNRCTFCIIPKLRGDLVSRPAADVLREAERLVTAGVKELLVISQDTSAYGVDIKYAASKWKDREVRAKFLDLSRELGTLGAWVRLHYVYPYPHVDDVIPLMADGVVLPYLDIPFQHAAPDVLKRMKRPAAQAKTLERIARWREICPDITLRSTFIVGFPGETDAGFRDAARMARRGLARPRRLLPLRAGRGRDRERPRRRCPQGRHRRALAPVHGAPAGDLEEAAQAQGRHAPAGHHRRSRSRPLQKAGPGATRRKSTARSMWRAGGRCGSARSPPSRSSAPTNTTCTARPQDSDASLFRKSLLGQPQITSAQDLSLPSTASARQSCAPQKRDSPRCSDRRPPGRSSPSPPRRTGPPSPS